MQTRIARGGCGVLLAISLAVLASPPAVAQTLDRIRETGTLRLGYRADARPLSFEDKSGKASGYALAICREVADAVRLELALDEFAVETRLLGTNDRFIAVEQGQVDLLCGAATPTLSRRESVSFSIPIFLGGIGAMLRKDAPARLRAVLAGEEPQYRAGWRSIFGQILKRKTFSARIGSTAETWLNERISDFGIDADVVATGEHAEGVERVVTGETDVLFGDRAILLDVAQQNPAADELLVLNRYFTYESIALALARGDEDFRLLVDRVLSQLYRSGEIGEIYITYFGEPDDAALALFSRAGLPD